jgi:hypothetical protein
MRGTCDAFQDNEAAKCGRPAAYFLIVEDGPSPFILRFCMKCHVGDGSREISLEEYAVYSVMLK